MPSLQRRSKVRRVTRRPKVCVCVSQCVCLTGTSERLAPAWPWPAGPWVWGPQLPGRRPLRGVTPRLPQADTGTRRLLAAPSLVPRLAAPLRLSSLLWTSCSCGALTPAVREAVTAPGAAALFFFSQRQTKREREGERGRGRFGPPAARLCCIQEQLWLLACAGGMASRSAENMFST